MKTILLIEDDPDILDNLKEFFEMEGFEILLANNGTTGYELASAFIPDLIVCDVFMRKMNGHEVLRLLLMNHKTSEIPLIFSTSLSENIDRTESLELGADEHIVKPFRLETLLNMVNVLLKTGSKRKRQHSNMV